MKLGVVRGVLAGALLTSVPAFGWGVGSGISAPPAPSEGQPPAAPPSSAEAPVAPGAAPAPTPSAAAPSSDTATPVPESAPPAPPGAAPVPIELEETPAPPPAPERHKKKRRRDALPPELAPPPTTAEAPPDEQPPARRAARRRWYGWQLLAADGASFALLFMSEETASLGVLSYVLAPPIIHWAHGQTGSGFGSLGLRIGMPLGGAVLGAVAGRCTSSHTSSECNDTLPAIGGLLGVAGAIAIDAAVLGYDDKPRHASAAILAPVLEMGRGEARVGLGGTF